MKPIHKTLIIFAAIAIILIIVMWQKKASGNKSVIKDNSSKPPKNNTGGSGTSNMTNYANIINALPDGSYPLVKGQKSKLVFLLQYALDKTTGDNLVLDGIFGPKTLESVNLNFTADYVTKEQANDLLTQVIQYPDIDPYIIAAFANLK